MPLNNNYSLSIFIGRHCMSLIDLNHNAQCGIYKLHKLSFTKNNIKVLSSNSAPGEVCLIQHYVIKFVSYLRQVTYPEMTLHGGNSIVCIFYMIYIEDIFYNCMHVNCRNRKWDNRKIFEVPGVYKNSRRQTLTLALTVYVKV